MGLAEPLLAIAAAVLLGIVGARELAAGLRGGLARHRNKRFARPRHAVVFWSLLGVQALLFLGATTSIYLILLTR
jgi:hypothetical protein